MNSPKGPAPLSAVVLDAVAETFENMAFMEVRPLRRYCARVAVLAPIRGRVTLALPEALANAMAEIIYSTPRDLHTDAMLLDVAAEIGNTIAGRLVRHVVSADTLFELDVPEKSLDMLLPQDSCARIFNYAIDSHCCVVIVEGRGLVGDADPP